MAIQGKYTDPGTTEMKPAREKSVLYGDALGLTTPQLSLSLPLSRPLSLPYSPVSTRLSFLRRLSVLFERHVLTSTPNLLRNRLVGMREFYAGKLKKMTGSSSRRHIRNEGSSSLLQSYQHRITLRHPFQYIHPV